MSQERLFLCEFTEARYTPIASARQIRSGDKPDLPYWALQTLRNTFKSLSVDIKTAAVADQKAAALVRTWYSEHMLFGANLTAIQNSSGPSFKRPRVAAPDFLPLQEPDRDDEEFNFQSTRNFNNGNKKSNWDKGAG